MKTLNVMSIDFTYKAALRGYESVVLARAWNGMGVTELVISTGVTNADLIETDDILWFDNDKHKAYIVERIESGLEGGDEKLYITAKSIKSLLEDFITIPPNGYDYDSRAGNREVIVRAWVNENCINPTDIDRAQYPIVLGAIRGFGSSITEQTRYKNLAAEITRVLATEDLGWGLELDLENEQFIFEVYQGVNRTSTQSVNPRALFGVRYGNIAAFHGVKDSLAARTAVYVGGQGEGSERTVVEVNDAAATRRREAFVDARDTDVANELTERGQQALVEAAAVSSYEFETLDRQFAYGIDYDLGDYVTVVIDKNTYQHLQIRRIQEIYEPENIRIVPEFGAPQRTLNQVIGTIKKKVSSLETVEIVGGGGVQINDGVPAADAVYSSLKVNNTYAMKTDIPENAIFPAGAIVASVVGAASSGWLECDGSAVSRETYDSLFAAIGTAYGSGDGSTTFNLPNIKGKVIVGYDSAQTEFDSIGKSGGEKTHQLTIDEMPRHNHTLKGDNDTGPDGGDTIGTDDTPDTTLEDASCGYTGGDQPHNNLQPFISLKWIIKT
jgi:microcystin-dependent protein